MALLVAVLAVVSCVGDSPDVDDDPTDAGGAEGGLPDGNEPMDVVTADAGTSDADATTEASAGKGCAAYPDAAFCADFDHGGAPQDGWTGMVVTGSNAIVLDSTGFVSPPASLRTTLTGSGEAILTREVPSQARFVRVELSARVSVFSSSASELGQILRLYRNNDYNPGIQIVAKSGAAQLVYTNLTTADGGPLSSGGSGTLVISPNAWTRFVLEVVFDDPGSIMLSIDGNKAVNVTDLNLGGTGGAAGTGGYTLWVGSTTNSGTDHPTVVTDLDDVVLSFP
jgi:hypothetical protein